MKELNSTQLKYQLELRGVRLDPSMFTGKKKNKQGEEEIVDRITKPEIVDMIFQLDNQMNDLPGSRKNTIIFNTI